MNRFLVVLFRFVAHAWISALHTCVAAVHRSWRCGTCRSRPSRTDDVWFCTGSPTPTRDQCTSTTHTHAHFGTESMNTDRPPLPHAAPAGKLAKQYPTNTGNVSKSTHKIYKIYKQHSSCSVRSSYFSERVANIWNSLPVDTDFSSLARFIHCINSLEFIDFCYIKC